MDIKKLESFLQVAELGSFSKASAVLSVAQSALSRQVLELERALGTKLLYRHGRGVHPTEAGERLMHHGRAIIGQIARARDDVLCLDKAPSGLVRLGIPPSTTEILVIPLIKRLRHELPQVSLKIVEGFSGYLEEWLLSGRIDVAILYSAPKSKGVIIDPLLTEDLYLVEPPGWKPDPGETVSLSEALRMPLIMPGRPHGLRLLVDAMGSHVQEQPNVVLELDALSAIKELVHLEMGYAIQPFAAVHREVERGELAVRRIIEPEVTRSLLLATPTEQALTAAASGTARVVKAEIMALEASGIWISHRDAKSPTRNS